MSKIIQSIRTMLQQPKPASLSSLTGIVLAALDAGAYIAKLEMRYQTKSQRLGEVRRENFELKRRIAQLEKLLPPSQAIETIELDGDRNIRKTKSADLEPGVLRESQAETLARYRANHAELAPAVGTFLEPKP